MNNRSLIYGMLVTVLLFLAAAPGFSINSGDQPEKKVNINTASSESLQTLPRIGPQVAQRIIDFREKNGKFKRIEELMKVRGIGEKTFSRLKDRITVGEAPAGKKTSSPGKKKES